MKLKGTACAVLALILTYTNAYAAHFHRDDWWGPPTFVVAFLAALAAFVVAVCFFVTAASDAYDHKEGQNGTKS